jgi:hypothetical protein
MNFEEFLQHYGTKGMKWGVRKGKVPKQGPSDDAKRAHKSFVKATVSGPQALSNKELNALNQRLNLEQNYQKLSYNPGPAKKIIDAIFKTGKQVNDAVEFANSPSGRAMQAAIKAPSGAKGAAAKAVLTTTKKS